MKPVAKRNIIIITVNTLVMTCFFLIKYVFLPRIPNINLTIGSDLFFLLTWVPIPLISIIGLALEQQRVLFLDNSRFRLLRIDLRNFRRRLSLWNRVRWIFYFNLLFTQYCSAR